MEKAKLALAIIYPNEVENNHGNQKQIQNRLNALASTGPKTDVGKAVVAQNAVKMGAYAMNPVVPGLETEAEWQEFREGLVAHLAPNGALEYALAERVASCLWRMRRVTTAEAGAIDCARNDFLLDMYASDDKRYEFVCRQADVGDESELADLKARLLRIVQARSLPDDAMAAKIARYEAHLSRQMAQALHELQRLQAARTGATFAPPAVLDVNVHAADSLPINGFAKQSQFDGPVSLNGADVHR